MVFYLSMITSLGRKEYLCFVSSSDINNGIVCSKLALCSTSCCVVPLPPRFSKICLWLPQRFWSPTQSQRHACTSLMGRQELNSMCSGWINLRCCQHGRINASSCIVCFPDAPSWGQIGSNLGGLLWAKWSTKGRHRLWTWCGECKKMI
jgi:hypothetical protein